MFVKFETSSTVDRKGFMAYIHRIGKLISLKISEKVAKGEKSKLFYFIYYCTDDNCQYWKNLQDMTLSSPNYPKWYNADGIGCEWLISAPEGFIIALEFNHFHVRYLLDFVKKFVLTLCNICFSTY